MKGCSASQLLLSLASDLLGWENGQKKKKKKDSRGSQIQVLGPHDNIKTDP